MRGHEEEQALGSLKTPHEDHKSTGVEGEETKGGSLLFTRSCTCLYGFAFLAPQDVTLLNKLAFRGKIQNY